MAFQAVAGELPPGVDLTFFGSDALGPQVPAGCDFVSVGGFDGSEQDAGNVSVLAIQRAVESAMRGEYRALVTAPVSKPALRAAGRDVPGQTELLQQLTGCESVGMLMAAIMVLRFLASLLMLPAVITLFKKGEAVELEAETS